MEMEFSDHYSLSGLNDPTPGSTPMTTRGEDQAPCVPFVVPRRRQKDTCYLSIPMEDLHSRGKLYVLHLLRREVIFRKVSCSRTLKLISHNVKVQILLSPPKPYSRQESSAVYNMPILLRILEEFQ
jgi:hypothetical protein